MGESRGEAHMADGRPSGEARTCSPDTGWNMEEAEDEPGLNVRLLKER
eukprot:CAMPEP_0177764438 /NCGR_PEP_ID=MMETSP0491_2-20121128/7403_1 /TAXON_ID=63592 /ORGANISM="Tetraselmis chuii, Strain PLY429" /LENGTH=47 /DNA_ID= /DNA_START= /DNA_END= /DNA_ORIENTATION=